MEINSGVPTLIEASGRPYRRPRLRKRPSDPARSEALGMYGTFLEGTARSSECLRREGAQTASGSLRTHADDGRPEEV